MAILFSYRRNCELSLVDYIQEQVAQDWSNVTVVKAFLKAYEKPLPVICVRMIDVASERYEVGDNELNQSFTFSIDIFATSDGLRLDLADYILNLIKEGCPYYVYSKNSGNKEILDRDADGRLTFISIVTDAPIEAYEDGSEHDRYRHRITFIYR